MSNLNFDSEVDIKPDLKKLSLKELRKLKEEVGNEIYRNSIKKTGEKTRLKTFKRDNKNRPSEVSSKIEPSLTIKKDKPQIEPEVRQSIDPRFDSLYGEFNRRAFERDYGFLRDIQSKEKKKLQKKLKSKESADKKADVKFLLQRIENQEREKQKLDAQDNVLFEQKKKRLQDLKEGKKPQFLKKSETKILQLVSQYEDLKSTGKLNKHIKKKRVRAHGNEKKKMFANNAE